MKKKARIIITYDCFKNCDGCCMKNWTGAPPKPMTLKQIVDEKYDEIMITGGEPMIYPEKTLQVIRYFRIRTRAKIYLYTASPYPFYKFLLMLSYLHGFSITIHDEEDKKRFLEHQLNWRKFKNLSTRLNLFIPFDAYLASTWDKRYMVWKKDCPLPEFEELIDLNMDGGNHDCRTI